MSAAHSAVDATITTVDRLRDFLKKKRSVQVTASEERAIIKATSLAWFNNSRVQVVAVIDEPKLSAADTLFHSLLSATDRATSRSHYQSWLKSLRLELSKIRGLTLIASPSAAKPTTDTPPSFAALVPDPAMQNILARRWNECATCVKSGAPLAATVMMGGLLESLLLARVHKDPNKQQVFSANSAPKDPKTTKTLALQEWTLRHYIDVAHELKWISKSAKDVGEVLRDYRNYIHPHKELSHGITLVDGDAMMFWEISKAISRQLL